ncbi:DUF4241 domain-containing protein [Nonomuraea sp. ZG12]|uniref:DUF4241 domain-containing protein n=1 Tax=Nonomuraea sp. ZG12 TaxID=3452207 RepID=UPI003F8B2604
MGIQAADFENMFRDDARYRWPNGETLRISVRNAGKLRLSTGRIVVRDNDIRVESEIDDSQAFAEKIPAGEYNVMLSIVNYDESPHPVRPRAAAAKIVIKEELVSSWEPALCPGQDPTLLAEDAFFGFSVDSGQGCYLDLAAMEFLKRTQEDYAKLDGARDLVMRNCFAELVDPDSGLNVILFDCGMGDGFYPTWIGRTSNGQIACFATDLELLSHSEGVLPR